MQASLIRVVSCGFVDRLFGCKKSDPRNHTNDHEQILTLSEILSVVVRGVARQTKQFVAGNDKLKLIGHRNSTNPNLTLAFDHLSDLVAFLALIKDVCLDRLGV